jgi:hypothetical protein
MILVGMVISLLLIALRGQAFIYQLESTGIGLQLILIALQVLVIGHLSVLISPKMPHYRCVIIMDMSKLRMINVAQRPILLPIYLQMAVLFHKCIHPSIFSLQNVVDQT